MMTLTRTRTTATGLFIVALLASAISFVAIRNSASAQPARAPQVPAQPLQHVAFTATGMSGNLYIADTNSNRVLKISAAGKTVATSSQFVALRGVAVNLQGQVYVADMGSCSISKLSSNLQLRSRWATCGARSEGYDGPVALTVDRYNRVYVVSLGTPRIETFSSAGRVLGWTNTMGSRVQFTSIAVDARGTVYLADPEGHGIVELATGKRVQEWGTYGTGAGQFEMPASVAVDAQGNSYVADVATHRVQKFSPARRLLARWRGRSASGVRFADPIGVSSDARGSVYVIDPVTRAAQRLSM